MTVPPAPVVTPALHHPGILRHRSVRLLTAGLWLAGAAVVWVDSAAGPFSWWFLPGLLMCLTSGLVLRWSYRRILAWAPEAVDALDEREASERARTFRVAYLILCLVLIVLLFPSMFVLSGHQSGG